MACVCVVAPVWSALCVVVPVCRVCGSAGVLRGSFGALQALTEEV